MKTKIILLVHFLCFLMPVTSFATVIKGRLIPSDNRLVSVLAFSNYFTKNTYSLAQSNADQTGNIKIEFEISEIQLIRIEANGKLLDMYVSPQGSYEIGFEKENLVLLADSNEQINATLKQIDKDFVQWFVSFLNTENHFLKDSTISFAQVATNLQNIEKKYANEKNAYLADLIRYKFADRKLGLYQMSFLFKTLNTKDLYENIESEYFTNSLINLKNPFYINLLTNYITDRGNVDLLHRQDYTNFSTVDRVLNESTYFKSDSLRALAKVTSVHIIYNNKWFEDELIFIRKADSIKNSIKIKPYQSIIQEIVSAHNKFKVGDDFPKYLLKNQFGKLLSTDAMSKDKYILIDFWFTGCPGCVREMRNFPDMVEKYKDQLVFASISIDESFEKMQKFIKKNNYNWLFLHSGQGSKLISDLFISGYPTYFIISPEGKVVYISESDFKPSLHLEAKLKELKISK